MRQQSVFVPLEDETIYYVWLGGSCDYNRKERFGGAACTIEKTGVLKETLVLTGTHTTEFRMMLAMIKKVMSFLPESSNICFLTNVAYLHNFDKPPFEGAANSDLIEDCIKLKKRHINVVMQLIPFRKYPQMAETHELARQAMLEIRK